MPKKTLPGMLGSWTGGNKMRYSVDFNPTQTPRAAKKVMKKNVVFGKKDVKTPPSGTIVFGIVNENNPTKVSCEKGRVALDDIYAPNSRHCKLEEMETFTPEQQVMAMLYFRPQGVVVGQEPGGGPLQYAASGAVITVTSDIFKFGCPEPTPERSISSGTKVYALPAYNRSQMQTLTDSSENVPHRMAMYVDPENKLPAMIMKYHGLSKLACSNCCSYKSANAAARTLLNMINDTLIIAKFNPNTYVKCVGIRGIEWRYADADDKYTMRAIVDVTGNIVPTANAEPLDGVTIIDYLNITTTCNHLIDSIQRTLVGADVVTIMKTDDCAEQFLFNLIHRGRTAYNALAAPRKAIMTALLDTLRVNNPASVQSHYAIHTHGFYLLLLDKFRQEIKTYEDLAAFASRDLWQAGLSAHEELQRLQIGTILQGWNPRNMTMLTT